MRFTRLKPLLIVAVLLLALAAAGYAWLAAGLPSPETAALRLNVPSVRIMDRYC